MFNKSIDERLSLWIAHRKDLEESLNPFLDVWEFWKSAPFVPYNSKIDRYFDRNWPSPWEIIVDNIYDDFTKALMIGWTIKLTDRFKNSLIEVRTLLDNSKPSQYNVVCIDNEWVINYSDQGPVLNSFLPSSFFLENIIEVKLPR